MVLKYPSDLSSRYYLSLNFQQYKRPDPFTQEIKLIQPNPGSSICLPMPSELRNKLDLNWNSTATLDPAAELALDAASGQISQGAAAQATGELAGKILPGFTAGAIAAGVEGLTEKNISGAMDKIASTISSFGSKAATDALQRVGLAMNPILTVQFKSPRFKVYSFSWRFAPDNSTDDNNLDAITQIIDYNSKPSIEFGGAFFGYPSIATIQLVTPKSAYGLFQIQPCVITSFEVNYAPHGIPSFLSATSHAAIIDVKMEILEIILNTRNNGVPQSALAIQNNPTYLSSSIGSAVTTLETNIQNAAPTIINGMAGALVPFAGAFPGLSSTVTAIGGFLGGK